MKVNKGGVARNIGRQESIESRIVHMLYDCICLYPCKSFLAMYYIFFYALPIREGCLYCKNVLFKNHKIVFYCHNNCFTYVFI